MSAVDFIGRCIKVQTGWINLCEELLFSAMDHQAPGN